MTNIPSINSLKFGSNNMESSYIKTKLVTKDDYNHWDCIYFLSYKQGIVDFGIFYMYFLYSAI